MITKFRLFENEGDGKFEYQGRYLNLQKLDTGNLKIILTDDGREEMEEGKDDFSDLFDDIRSNSDYLYWESIGDAGLGMSDAPCITDGYYFDDNGDLTEGDDSEIFWFPNYMVENFIEELVENGFVIFNTNKPISADDVKKIKFQRKVNKYNL